MIDRSAEYDDWRDQWISREWGYRDDPKGDLARDEARALADEDRVRESEDPRHDLEREETDAYLDEYYERHMEYERE